MEQKLPVHSSLKLDLLMVISSSLYSFCTEVQGDNKNGTLSPMRGISLFLYPTLHSQRAATPGTSCPTLFQIVCGFFNVQQCSKEYFYFVVTPVMLKIVPIFYVLVEL